VENQPAEAAQEFLAGKWPRCSIRDLGHAEAAAELKVK
jgi:hypothetical protein